MRKFLLSQSSTTQFFLIVSSTIFAAFITAGCVHYLFHSFELLSKTGLITSIYAVLGTIYAVLVAFSVSGVWNTYCNTDMAVAIEAASLTDLIHMSKASSTIRADGLQELAAKYVHDVIDIEWPALARGNINALMSHDAKTFRAAMEILSAVQATQTTSDRDNIIYSQMLTLLIKWLDARRNRILLARGNTAKALWPLLISGAFALFAFHGLFITENHILWGTLLFLFSAIVGSSLYLIFTLDCPFSGIPAIDKNPFYWSLSCLEQDYK